MFLLLFVCVQGLLDFFDGTQFQCVFASFCSNNVLGDSAKDSKTPNATRRGPAHRAGIQPGDLLVAADDQWVSQQS